MFVYNACLGQLTFVVEIAFSKFRALMQMYEKINYTHGQPALKDMLRLFVHHRLFLTSF